MIRWCAYCQRYLGEAPPFDRYAMTHGICDACEVKSATIRGEHLARIRRIGSFFSDVRRQALEGNTASLLTTVVAEASELGIRPTDLFMGIFQPILYEIGEAWALCKVSVAQEHAFTAFANQLLDTVPVPAPGDLDKSASIREVDALLICSNGNFHSLGVRILSFALSEVGVPGGGAGNALDSKWGLPFKKLCNLKAGETVVFAFVIYKSKADRNRINAKVHKDPRMQQKPEQKLVMPFDMKRFSMGGFKAASVFSTC